MGADNWAICPRCSKKHAELVLLSKKNVQESYGKVPPEEYERLKIGLANLPKLDDNLREDFSIGVDKTGEFVVSYGAHCEECGFSFSYEWKQRADA